MSKFVLNVKYLLLLSFLTAVKFYNLGHIQGIMYKGALTQKRSFLVICTTFRSDFCDGWKNQNKHSTLNLSFNALPKRHDADISLYRPVTYLKIKINRFWKLPKLRQSDLFINFAHLPKLHFAKLLSILISLVNWLL